MEHALDPGAFKEILIVLGATALIIPILQRAKLSPVIGFLLLGMALGPFGLAALAAQAPWIGAVTITDPESLAPVAEWGVVLLMFMIGLELSFERLKMMRKYVFGLGPAQVLVCALALTGAALALGAPLTGAIVIGLALAQSSTAVLVQTLADEKKLAAPMGRISFSVLLFQDIAVTPILFGVAMLAVARGEQTLAAFGAGFGQAAIALIAVLVIGRLGLRPLFRSVARAESPETFLAACLLVILGTSLAVAAAGLSAAMGALIAGLLLAETEYRRQVEALVEPFKGLFLGVFLISAGMGIDLHPLLTSPFAILAGGILLIAVKAGLIYGLARLLRASHKAALGAALVLGPGGEFAFVILSTAGALHTVPTQYAQAAQLIAALTMFTIPFLSRLHDRLTREPKKAAANIDPALLPPAEADGESKVLIAGFGRVGRVVADMLEAHNVPYQATDTNIDVVTAARREGRPVFYGDASNVQLLRQCGLDTMRALVATMDSSAAVETIVATARGARGDLLIVARARDAERAAKLYKLGANDVAPETIEASLQLSETVLVDLGVPMGPVIASIHDRRAAFRDEVQKLEPGVIAPARPRRRLREMMRNKEPPRA